jgi:hypothetical protein
MFDVIAFVQNNQLMLHFTKIRVQGAALLLHLIFFSYFFVQNQLVAWYRYKSVSNVTEYGTE